MDAPALLRLARRRHSLTQSALAQRAGTSQPVISAYEHGRRDPTTATLRRLLAAAGEQLQLGLATRVPELTPPVDAQEHGDRLVEVLRLADAIGHRPRGPLAFPRIDST